MRKFESTFSVIRKLVLQVISLCMTLIAPIFLIGLKVGNYDVKNWTAGPLLLLVFSILISGSFGVFLTNKFGNYLDYKERNQRIGNRDKKLLFL